MTTTIAVRGEATVHVPAERGTVHLSVGFTGADRAEVVRATTALHGTVTAAARAHESSGAATWWSADQVGVGTYREYQKDSDVTVLRYRANASVAVKFRDFAALAAWIADVGEREGVTLGAVEWAVTEQHRAEVERRVRVDAVQDAIARAGDYASAIGLGAPTLVAVYEPGLRPSESTGSGPTGMSARMMKSPTNSGDGIVLKPEDIAISAEITADFTA